MRSRSIVVLGGMLLATLGCADAGQSTSDTGALMSESVGLSDPPAADTSAAVGEAGDDVSAPASSMVGLLGTLPRAAYDEAIARGATSVEIELTDYAGATLMAGLERPSSDDVEASIEWMVSLTFISTVASGGTGFGIRPASFPDPNGIVQYEEIAAELGFSVMDLDRSAVLTAPPLRFATVQGDALELSPDLIEIGNGVVSAGSGADLFQDLDTRTSARPLGRPLRLGSIDGMVAASLSTPALEAWLAGGPTMVEVESLALAAEALDSAGAVSSSLIDSDFAPYTNLDDLTQSEAGFSARFEVVGLGITMVDDRAANAIAYVFADDAAAAAVQPEVDAAWRTNELVSRQGATMLDYFDVVSVEQRGRVVLVVAAVTDGSTSLGVWDLLYRAEPIFTNS